MTADVNAFWAEVFVGSHFLYVGEFELAHFTDLFQTHLSLLWFPHARASAIKRQAAETGSWHSNFSVSVCDMSGSAELPTKHKYNASNVIWWTLKLLETESKCGSAGVKIPLVYKGTNFSLMLCKCALNHWTVLCYRDPMSNSDVYHDFPCFWQSKSGNLTLWAAEQ